MKLSRGKTVALVGAFLLLAFIAWRQSGFHRGGTSEPRKSDEAASSSQTPATAGTHNAMQAGAPAGPTLFYALSYQETAASIRAKPDQYNIFTADQAQKLVMVRQRSKNAIYAFSLVTEAPQLVFSDEGPNFEILPDGQQAFALGGGKAYVRGVEREWRTGPSPGAFSKPAGIYELTLDGSNRWRKLFELEAENAPELFTTADGSKLGYLTGDYGKETVSIYALPEAKLLQRWNVRQWSQDRCPDANFSRAGWLADGKTLFLTLQSAAGDEPTAPGCDQTYLLSEEGKELGRMSAESSDKSSPAGGAVFIGQAMDGRNLFMTYRQAQGQAGGGGWLALAADSQKPAMEQARLRARPEGIFFWLSPSGQYLAFREGRFDSKTGTSETHVWVKDLNSQKEIDAATVLPVKYGSPEARVTIHVLGVVDRKN